MTDPRSRRRALGMVRFTFLAGVILFIRLLPLAPGKIVAPGPDILLCLCFSWVLRRPEQVPALLIAAVFFVSDVMLMQPLGLWTFFVLLATEALRARASRWRDQAFVFEWLRVALLLGLMTAGARLMMVLLFVPTPALGQVVMQYLASVLCYPLVVGVGWAVLGLRRPPAGES